VPTIGIGAGSDTDGQVLVWHDMLGFYEGNAPRFVKRYAELGEVIVDALRRYADDVRGGSFPDEQHTYAMPAEEREAFESRSGQYVSSTPLRRDSRSSTRKRT
jgi:3-methyl-2-oxobutanoate hydroxymethyltransferase